jgi:hypothetical protein
MELYLYDFNLNSDNYSNLNKNHSISPKIFH